MHTLAAAAFASRRCFTSRRQMHTTDASIISSHPTLVNDQQGKIWPTIWRWPRNEFNAIRLPSWKPCAAPRRCQEHTRRSSRIPPRWRLLAQPRLTLWLTAKPTVDPLLALGKPAPASSSVLRPRPSPAPRQLETHPPLAFAECVHQSTGWAGVLHVVDPVMRRFGIAVELQARCLFRFEGRCLLEARMQICRYVLNRNPLTAEDHEVQADLGRAGRLDLVGE